MIRFDGYDDAVIGITTNHWRDDGEKVLVYSGEKMVELMMAEGSSQEDALDHIAYNCEGGYLGPATPIIVWLEPHWSYEFEQD